MEGEEGRHDLDQVATVLAQHFEHFKNLLQDS